MRKTFEHEHKGLKKINIGEDYACYFYQLPLVPIDKISKVLYGNMKWNINKANVVLDRTLSKTLKYSKEDDCYYYSCDWRIYFSDYAPFYLKYWSKKFQHRIDYYLRSEYKNPNYIKSFDRDDDGVWIKFEKKC